LNQSQQQARGQSTDDILGGDTQLSDQSVTGGPDQARPSVLDIGAPQQSYTQGQGEEVGSPMAGGGMMDSSGMELQRMRAKEAEMRRVQETMVQAAPEPTAAPGTQGPGQAVGVAGAAGGAGAPPAGEEEGEEEGEAQRAMNVAQQRAQSVRQRATDKAAQEAQKAVERELKRVTKRAVGSSVRGVLEGAEGVTSEFVVGLILLILQLNIQLFNKYFLKKFFEGSTGEGSLDGVPFFDQSFPEDVLTVGADTCLCCNWMLTPPCCIFTAIAGVIVMFAVLGDNVPGLKTVFAAINFISGLIK
jgi:hypothetical protein